MAAQQKAAGAATPATAQEINQHAHSTAGRDTERKRFATLAARFALAGHALIETEPGTCAAPLYATKWGLIKPLADLDAAERFLEQIGGGHGV